MNVAVLASGAGTNLQALLDQVHGRGGVEIVAVASDKPDARRARPGARARVSRREAFPADGVRRPAGARPAMADWLRERGVELVVLAGYMQLLSARVPRRGSPSA